MKALHCILAVPGLLLPAQWALAQSTTVNIDPTTKYQVMTGFGASLTESSAAAISKLNQTAQNSLMTSLFNSSSGAGLSFLRQPMGASDFRVNDYTYDDVPAGSTDYNLNDFSVAHDLTTYPGAAAGTNTSIISLLQQAESVNPKLSVMGTPWTAPGWMKTGTTGNIVPQAGVTLDQRLYNGTLLGSTTSPSPTSAIYQTYANYFVKYVQGYAAEGIPVNFITPQNEPYNGSYAYPSMTLTPQQQTALVIAIGTAFQTNLVNPNLPFNAQTNPYIFGHTKIEILDHNWNDAVPTDANGNETTQISTNITSILGNPGSPSTAMQYVDGIAFHGYGGGVSAQNVIQAAYPTNPDTGKPFSIMFTEQTGTVGSVFASDLMYDMENLVVGGTRDWASTITKFNLALDETSGPKIETTYYNNGSNPQTSQNSGDDNARGVVTINSKTGAITYNEEYYALGQIAKFVEPGATRISSDSANSVAFLNPDNTEAVVAYNASTTSAASYNFQQNGVYFAYALPVQSVVTFSWNSLAAYPSVTLYETTGDQTKLLAQLSNVAFVPASGLVWSGQTDKNWTSASNFSGSTFSTGSAVNFGDDEADKTGANAAIAAVNTTPITIPAAGVSPSSVTFFNKSAAYQFTSTGAVGIGGTGGVLINGGGTVIFSSPNTYSGGTNISSGTLKAASASLLATGLLTIGASGQLYVGDGSSLVPTTLTTGAQTWTGGGSYHAKVDGNGNADLLSIGGGAGILALSGSSAFNIVAQPGDVALGQSAEKWELAAFSSLSGYNGALPTATGVAQGVPVDSQFALDTSALNSGVSSFSLSLVQLSTGHEALYLDYSAAPEPSTALLIFAGAAPLLYGRRRAPYSRANNTQ